MNPQMKDKLRRSTRQSNFIVLYFSKSDGTYCRVITNTIINSRGYKLISDVAKRNYYDNVKCRNNSGRYYRCHRFSLRTGCPFLPNYAKWKNDIFIETPKPFRVVKDLNYNNSITKLFDYPDSFFRDIMLSDEWDSEDENELVIVRENNNSAVTTLNDESRSNNSVEISTSINSDKKMTEEEKRIVSKIDEEDIETVSPNINTSSFKNIVINQDQDSSSKIGPIKLTIIVSGNVVSIVISPIMNTSNMVDNEQRSADNDEEINIINNSDVVDSSLTDINGSPRDEIKNDETHNTVSNIRPKIDEDSSGGLSLYNDESKKNDYCWFGKQPTESVIIPKGAILVNDVDSLFVSNMKKRCIKILLNKNFISLGHFYLYNNTVILEKNCGEAYGDWIDFLHREKFMYKDGFYRSRHDRCGLNDWLIY